MTIPASRTQNSLPGYPVIMSQAVPPSPPRYPSGARQSNMRQGEVRCLFVVVSQADNDLLTQASAVVRGINLADPFCDSSQKSTFNVYASQLNPIIKGGESTSLVTPGSPSPSGPSISGQGLDGTVNAQQPAEISEGNDQTAHIPGSNAAPVPEVEAYDLDQHQVPQPIAVVPTMATHGATVGIPSFTHCIAVITGFS
jgi:hypothetical protein